jgi:hypothetical protein
MLMLMVKVMLSGVIFGLDGGVSGCWMLRRTVGCGGGCFID